MAEVSLNSPNLEYHRPVLHIDETLQENEILIYFLSPKVQGVVHHKKTWRNLRKNISQEVAAKMKVVSHLRKDFVEERHLRIHVYASVLYS